MNFRRVVFVLFTTFIFACTSASAAFSARDTVRKSSAAQAIAYLAQIKKLEKSKFWPNVDPVQFLNNLKTFTIEPLSFYEGKATNFCAYSALTYIPLEYDPLGFSKFMITLYKYGSANMGHTTFAPSKAVREEAGMIKYKGALDISPAGQMWFLSLADEFKGYLNLLNLRFNEGDENTFWASTNYAKFNRMLRRLFPAKVKAKGADMLRPQVLNLPDYLEQQLKKGIVFVYLNNKKLYRKSHKRAILSTPTHYVMLVESKRLENGDVEFMYWDYGKKSLQQLSPSFLRNIVYGVTTTTLKNKI